MPQPIIDLEVEAPGFMGLNTQESVGQIPPEYASVLSNVVFDEAGRLAARKGFNDLTTTAETGQPNVTHVFHYLKDKDTDYVLSTMLPSGDTNYNIYHGTTTLTDITGSIASTTGNWKFENFNGKVVAFEQDQDPIYWAGASNFDTIYNTYTDWVATTAYVLGDIVVPTSPSQTDIYFVCTTAGTSAGTEPAWNYTEAATTTDNTATWTAVKIPDGNEVHAAFGRLWAVDADKTTIRYSGLLDETIWDTTNGGGTIDMLSVWTYGGDEIVAVSSFNNFLIIFGKQNITVYDNADDPTNLAISDQFSGTGCIARDSVVNTGDDLLFLSFSGVETLERTVQNEKMPTADLSYQVRDDFLADVAGADLSTVRATFNQTEGFYLIVVNQFTYMFDLKMKKKGVTRVSVWNGININSCYYSYRDDTMYLGRLGKVGDYSGYNDGASGTYFMTYRSHYVDFRSINAQLSSRIKIPKKFRITVKDGNQYTVALIWAFDFKPSSTRNSSVVTFNVAPAEWNNAEWSNAEWSGEGTTIDDAEAYMTGAGEHIQFGFDIEIDGTSIAIQKMNVYAKIGRLAR